MAKVSRSRRRADRIRSDLPMARVLYDYGYAVNPDGGDREQQFPCDLHGDGRDGKASGRYYPSSNSIYCFACGRARDAVALTMEKEGVKFIEALDKLEKRYGLPPIVYDGSDEEEDVRPETVADVLAEHPIPYDDASERTDRFLRRITTSRAMSMHDTLRLWWDYDRVRYAASTEGWSDAKASATVDAVRVVARMAVGIRDDG